MKRTITALLAGLVLATSGCVNMVVGQPIDQDAVKRITPGRTTSDEVRSWFGSPRPGHTVKSDDGDIYVYRYLDGNGNCNELVISFSQDTVSTYSFQ